MKEFKNYTQVYSVIGEGNGTPLQYSCLENPMDRRAWWAAVHEVAKSRTRLNDFTFSFHLHALEKEMTSHSSVLAWRIPGMEEPWWAAVYGLTQVGHDWSDLAAAACIISLVLFLWRTLTNTFRFCLCMLSWKSERPLVYHTCIPWLWVTRS